LFVLTKIKRSLRTTKVPCRLYSVNGRSNASWSAGSVSVPTYKRDGRKTKAKQQLDFPGTRAHTLALDEGQRRAPPAGTSGSHEARYLAWAAGP